MSAHPSTATSCVAARNVTGSMIAVNKTTFGGLLPKGTACAFDALMAQLTWSALQAKDAFGEEGHDEKERASHVLTSHSPRFASTKPFKENCVDNRCPKEFQAKKSCDSTTDM